MSDVLIDRPELEGLGTYEFGWADSDAAGASARRGISPEVVADISALKGEPEWMLQRRQRALQLFERKPMPTWGADLSEIDFDNIKYFVRSTEKQAQTWEDLPDDIKNTYEKLGIPEAERQRLVAGVAAQYESEVVYHQINEELERQGVIFMDTDTALREHPEFFEEYFGTVIPAGDNKFAALNTAVWSGGSFVYVPPGVHVEIPLQAYFRINTENMGQFERTLIIADEGSYVHYIEGCTAPIYKSDSLHSAVVEIIVKKNARVRYTTIQNWSNNVYNLVTKRATAAEGATMEWIDGNIGSKVTMKYPSIYLMGEHAKGETLSVAFAGPGQHQDAGAKMIHMAPYTQSSIVSKSIARGGGRAGYRGEVRVDANAHHSANTVRCDALLVDTISRSDTYPAIDIRVDDVQLGHEATVSKVSEEQLFYLMCRGMPEDEAMAMIVRGFIEPIARELPMEYALELNKLIEMGMEGIASARNDRQMTSTAMPTAEQHGLRPHCDGAGLVPVQTRSERFRSIERRGLRRPSPAASSSWKLSPVAAFADLTGGELDGSAYEIETDGCRTASTSRWIGRDDARIGSAGMPEERASANAWTAFDEALAHLGHRRGGEEGRRRHPHRPRHRAARCAHRHRGRAVQPRPRRAPRTPATPASPRTSRSSLGEGALAHGRRRCRSGATTPCTSRTTSPASAATPCLKHIVVSLGGEVVRVNPSTHLAEQGADVEAFGLYFADAGQHLEQQVYVHHDAPHTRSRVTYKGALQGEGARTVWIGDVLIGNAATGTDSYEQNRNLVLTDGTRADSVPNLEIETGDIAGAGHASGDRSLRRRAAVLPDGTRHPRGRGASPRRPRLPHRDRAEDRLARARGAAAGRDRGRAARGR